MDRPDSLVRRGEEHSRYRRAHGLERQGRRGGKQRYESALEQFRARANQDKATKSACSTKFGIRHYRPSAATTLSAHRSSFAAAPISIRRRILGGARSLTLSRCWNATQRSSSQVAWGMHRPQWLDEWARWPNLARGARE